MTLLLKITNVFANFLILSDFLLSLWGKNYGIGFANKSNNMIT